MKFRFLLALILTNLTVQGQDFNNDSIPKFVDGDSLFFNDWNDTTYHKLKTINLDDSVKVLKYDLGKRAIIYISSLEFIKHCEQLEDRFSERRQIGEIIDSLSRIQDTTIINTDILGYDLDYLVVDLMREGKSKIYDKEKMKFVNEIFQRLEKAGTMASRWFYFPDKRAFFSNLEITGIIENGVYFSDPKELGKQYDRLREIGN
jgi:hypothetical protein